MRVISRAEIGRLAWNALVDAAPPAWWFHRWEWMEYEAARKIGEELSFGVEQHGQLVAICPLFLENRELTMEGHPGPCPLVLESGQPELECHLSRILAERRPSRLAFRGVSFARGDWADISWHTQVLDLTLSSSALHAGLRHSYRALINKASRDYEIVVDAEGKLMEDFRLLHQFDAGRETRPKETWEMQAEWCRQGNGLIVAAYSGARMVGAVYWILYKKGAYLASMASAVDSVSHALLWRGLMQCRSSGVEIAELGWQGYATDPKGKAIEFFKRGFGGRAVLVLAVERRWNQ